MLVNRNSQITSRAFVLAQTNIDTDQIIPARYLTTTTRAGLGHHAFADWRYGPDGSPRRDCPLNHAALDGASILIAGRNFGCGSSREHAAWALADLGIRAVISPEIADIFRSNALKNGIAPIEIEADAHALLSEQAARGAEVTIDLESQEVRCADEAFSFRIDPFGLRCLIEGVDDLGWLMGHMAHIERFEEARA